MREESEPKIGRFGLLAGLIGAWVAYLTTKQQCYEVHFAWLLLAYIGFSNPYRGRIGLTLTTVHRIGKRLFNWTVLFSAGAGVAFAYLMAIDAVKTNWQGANYCLAGIAAYCVGVWLAQWQPLDKLVFRYLDIEEQER